MCKDGLKLWKGWSCTKDIDGIFSQGHLQFINTHTHKEVQTEINPKHVLWNRLLFELQPDLYIQSKPVKNVQLLHDHDINDVLTREEETRKIEEENEEEKEDGDLIDWRKELGRNMQLRFEGVVKSVMNDNKIKNTSDITYYIIHNASSHYALDEQTTTKLYETVISIDVYYRPCISFPNMLLGKINFCVMANEVLEGLGQNDFRQRVCPYTPPHRQVSIDLNSQTLYEMLGSSSHIIQFLDRQGKHIASVNDAKDQEKFIFESMFNMDAIQRTCSSYGHIFNHTISFTNHIDIKLHGRGRIVRVQLLTLVR
ncbi:hypothetical protein BDA99DRAFT_543491 [Phascolomyces articulosus]|uniref:Uncharacterized protein n=1 Tax=Phascolomyces articulosus TaxID=60185 RepID=A0AAD5P7N5_9FUNG|nr:hypothetical protein BDA99DRAFT_543491 [Phascolomyces articulosus]